MITFDHPFALILLACIPPLIYVRHFWKKRGGRIELSFSLWKNEVFTSKLVPAKFMLFLTTVAFWIGCSSLIIAFAGPSLVTRERVYLSRGIDIMLVLDESPSMAALDFPPDNRFEKAKEVIIDFISGRENDPAGLVSFSREAMLRIPPTLDYDLLKQRTKELKIMELGDATAIGLGIAVATLHLQHSSADEQIIVLLTDGDNNAGEITPESAVRVAADMGIKIYTIGIGAEGEVPIELTDPTSGLVMRGMMQSGYNEELLQNIASITGGRYFPAWSPGALESVLVSIDSLETTEKRMRIHISKDQVHFHFVSLGFALIMGWFFIRKFLFREVF